MRHKVFGHIFIHIFNSHSNEKNYVQRDKQKILKRFSLKNMLVNVRRIIKSSTF